MHAWVFHTSTHMWLSQHMYKDSSYRRSNFGMFVHAKSVPNVSEAGHNPSTHLCMHHNNENGGIGGGMKTN